jgi:hypothetical protein
MMMIDVTLWHGVWFSHGEFDSPLTSFHFGGVGTGWSCFQQKTQTLS